MQGYKVQYSEDKNEVCIIPDICIPFDDFMALVKMYIDLGYTYWLAADHRCGYRFSKVCKDPNENSK